MASNESLDMLYRAMRPALYRCIAMAIEIAINLPAFFVAVDSLSPTTIAKSIEEMIKLSSVWCLSVCKEFLPRNPT